MMDNTMSLMLEKILQRIESLAAVTAELKENSIEQNDKIDRLAADSFEIKEELKKLNVKVENSIDPNIRLLAEGHSSIAQIMRDVQDIKKEQQDMKINVDALMNVVPEHNSKIEELKKHA